MNRILDKLPQKTPFLLIDEIVQLIPKEKCIVTKEVRDTDFYFKGHFPDFPIVPGCILVEMMAQASEVVVMADQLEDEGGVSKVFLAQILEANFYAPVKPNSVLIIEAFYKRRIGKIIETYAFIFCNNQRVAKCKLRMKADE